MCHFRRLTIPMIQSENRLLVVFQMFMIKNEKRQKKSMKLKKINKINKSAQGSEGMLIAYCSLMRDARFASC